MKTYPLIIERNPDFHVEIMREREGELFIRREKRVLCSCLWTECWLTFFPHFINTTCRPLCSSLCNVSTLIVLNVLCAKRWDIYIQLTQSSGLESSVCAGLVSWIKFGLILQSFFFIYLHARDFFHSNPVSGIWSPPYH